MHARCLFTSLLLVACSLAADPPKLRVDDSVRPVRYAADLTLRPEATTFSGTIDIDVELARPAGIVWLNAVDLTIRDASLVRAGENRRATVEPGDANFVGLRFPAEVPAGAARLHIQYEGKISPRNASGIFQGRDGNENYLYTQFESSDARRAFPCFDQPNFKTPWQLTLHIPAGDTAVSNTPQQSETPQPEGMKTVIFAPTKPLPSYLVAFAVGPFDIVDAGRGGKNHIPVRVVAPKGKGYQAKYAAEVTVTIVDQLENYFGIPFPYEKSDQVAIPLTYGFGAMENAGMVTYGQTILLADPATDSEQRKRYYAIVAAHELAHQWFGDLVTPAWWDDTWLNEAFATWMEVKILDQWRPEWHTGLDELTSKFDAMRRDSLASTRRIRQPIESLNDVSNAFDEITYQKGAAVIRMFESWAGEKQFQAGVTAYLKRYAYGNATVHDFLDSISSAAQPRLTRAFSTFLDQAGVPEVSVELNCAGAPRVKLSQKRYREIGSVATGSETWAIPVCVRYQTSGGPRKECFLLDRPSAEFALTQATSCPANLIANDDASGYYETAYQGNLLADLMSNSNGFLNASERITVLHDLSALADSGEAKGSQALEAVLPFSKAPERQVVAEAQRAAGSVRRLVPSNLLPNYHRFIRAAFGERADALSWSAKPGDDSDTKLQRASLVPFVAVVGDDRPLQAEARRLADGWLRDRKGASSEMLSAILSTAAHSGDRALFEAMLAEFKKSRDRRTRAALIGALGSFRDPALAQAAMELLLAPDLDIRETVALLYGPLGSPETERMPFAFVQANYDRLVARLPSGGDFDARTQLLAVGAGLCDAASEREFEKFFGERAKQYTGGPRVYAQRIESMHFCEARKAAQAADIAAFLAKQ
ncbi:MAG TPA: M1 family metallopeptidase [Bryobacteraceae bacterium]